RALDYEENYYYDDYDGYYGLSKATSAIYDANQTAQRFFDVADYANAARIYITVLDACTDVDEMPTEDDDYYFAVDDTVKGLADCLAKQDIASDDTLRLQALHALLGTMLWDINIGGIDFAADAHDDLFAYITTPDIPDVRGRIQAFKAKQASRTYGNWVVEACERLLSGLDVIDKVNPEVTLERLRDEGLLTLLVARLLELDRVAEAVAVIMDDIDEHYEQYTAILELDRHGEHDEALRLADDVYRNGNHHTHLINWLIEAHRKRGNANRQFELEYQRFDDYPNLQSYRHIRQLALSLNRWTDIRKDMIDTLSISGYQNVLVELYIDEGMWNKAWDCARKGTYGHGLLNVAIRARHDTPERSVQVMLDRVHALIDARGRDNYAYAAELLIYVDEVYDETGRSKPFDLLIDDIRKQYPRLRALQARLIQFIL
ncbi:MAG: hypothetical protein AAF125_24545, partial [Chloroflexota bacterium]